MMECITSRSISVLLRSFMMGGFFSYNSIIQTKMMIPGSKGYEKLSDKPSLLILYILLNTEFKQLTKIT